MADVQALALPLAVLATACLPAVVAAIICADEVIDRLSRAVDVRYEVWRRRRDISRFNRMIGVDRLDWGVDPALLDRNDRPAIEQLAADLRRLGQQRLVVADQPRARQDSVMEAYDGLLRQASRCLGVIEHLDDVEGVDLEIERIRVEGELQAAGLILNAAATGRQGE
ncbi:MAG TPA: hypothetical protein VFX60_15530 [Micromonospora sp.]|nr:hypothetical protein [Micromonospora sp.]